MAIIYVDGSGWNGKFSRYAVVFEDGTKILSKNSLQKTNNEMEYDALIQALINAKENDTIYTDSTLVVGQVTKNWKVKAKHLLPLVLHAQKVSVEKKIKIVWIPREKNLAGHLLERVVESDGKMPALQ